MPTRCGVYWAIVWSWHWLMAVILFWKNSPPSVLSNTVQFEFGDNWLCIGSQAAGLVMIGLVRAQFLYFCDNHTDFHRGTGPHSSDDRKQAALERPSKQRKSWNSPLSLFKTAYLYSICSLVRYFIAWWIWLTYIPAMFQAHGLAIHTVSNIFILGGSVWSTGSLFLLHLWTVSAIKFS